MQNVVRFASKAAVVLALILLGACAGKSEYMRDIAPEKANYAPESGKALVVFMRPSGFGFAIQSSVFDITSGDPVFLGIVSAKTKLAHHADSGKQRFMVLGENASFMDAMLNQGKVYYVVVSARMGVWKARFAFEPVHGADINTPEFSDWYADTRWVENLESAKEWARSNMPSIREKMAEYLPEWQQGADKAVLNLEDGQEGLYQAASSN